MTLHVLEVASRDVAAEALGLLLDGPAPSALAELRLEDRTGGVLTLGVLGASHVVTASRPGAQLTEEVSCDAQAAGGQQLPRRLGTSTYRIVTATRVVPSDRLGWLADRLRRQAGTDGWICGAFPGADAALTAMTGSAVRSGGWRWRTWHLYPGRDAGAVVETRSRWRP